MGWTGWRDGAWVPIDPGNHRGQTLSTTRPQDFVERDYGDYVIRTWHLPASEQPLPAKPELPAELLLMREGVRPEHAADEDASRQSMLAAARRSIESGATANVLSDAQIEAHELRQSLRAETLRADRLEVALNDASERANRLSDECGALATKLADAERERDRAQAEVFRLTRGKR